ncbi:hypothetical protein C4N9_12125 [Pararhodobacter marinus]|uniref:Uncharacterized protein n=1 Tax=Pararhodobacter marinus TaxID=2184063 RepID=A0A2U2CA34_9RHOB|nr:hypothetical protein [Pararhodobacter marinus]PWE28719.1 hypothetical protein C4N9_12125 [Pararhodobacter marinus]
MKLVLHIGAHGTDEGRIAQWIARNETTLRAAGILAPPPRFFLECLSDALDRGRDEDPVAREAALLDRLGAGKGAGDGTGQVIVSAPGLLGSVRDVLAADGFYVRDVARRLFALRSLFPTARITLLMAVAAPSQVLPALLPDDPQAQEACVPVLSDDTLPWARLAMTIRHHMPQARLRVWRHEDLPQVWPQVLGDLVGPDAALPPAGLLDLAAADLSAEARLRLERYIARPDHAPRSAGQLRLLCAAFARRFGTVAPRDRESDLPPWIRERLRALDAGYGTEWADLAALSGIEAITPA